MHEASPLRINLAEEGDAVLIPITGEKLALQLAPTDGHPVGIGIAAIALEWSLDGITWFALEDKDSNPVTFAAGSLAQRSIDVGGAHVLRATVTTGDGTADSAASIYHNFHSFRSE